MSDVYLSYDDNDSAAAGRFADQLVRQGLSVCWEQTQRGGDAYHEAREAELKAARAVIVLWSPHSAVSRLVRAEAAMADRNKKILPVTIAQCERPIMFELIQTADLSHWQGSGADPDWLRFVDDVRRQLADHGASPVPAPEPIASGVPDRAGGGPGNMSSIAVLPFRNRSGREAEDVLAAGMFEDLVEALSSSVNVAVISASVVTGHVHGGRMDIANLVARTGVRYLLEGNLRLVGEQLRVTAQLIETTGSEVLWTIKLERPLAEIGHLQEDLVLDLAAHLDVQVYRAEMIRSLRKPNNLTAWECVIRGMGAYYRRTPGKYLYDAIAEGEHAVQLAPDFGMAHALLASAKATAYMMASPDDPEKVAQIRRHIARAIEIDHDNALVLAHAANSYCLIGEPEQGRKLAERALELRGELGFAIYVHAFACAGCNDAAEAIRQYEHFHRNEPGSIMANISYPRLGQALVRAGRWHDAIGAFEEGLRADHRISYGYCQLAMIRAHLGEDAAALTLIQQTREHEPEATRELWLRRFSRLYINTPLRDEILALVGDLWTRSEPDAR